MSDENLIWSQLDYAIDTIATDLITVRRHLHAYPEPSGAEYETTRYLQHHLQEAGLETRLGPDQRGLVVDPPEKSPSSSAAPRIALRADIDALRIQDAKTVEYRSQHPGIMHACGHDGHTAVVLGALLGLQAIEQAGALPWPVNWRGIFQPAEELGTGALEMIQAGAIEGCEAILSVHMDPAREVGHIGLRQGALTAACDGLQATILGRGGHAARPHESLDPIVTAAQFISNIYLFIPRATDSHDPVVVTIGQILAGDNPNVIPEQAVLRGTLRTLSGTTRKQTKSHIQQLAKGLAEASGTSIKVEFTPGPPAVHNNARLIHLLKHVGVNLLGAECVANIERPSMGGEDFAFYLDHIPGAMFRLGCASPPQPGHATHHTPLHSPAFDLDEHAPTIGAKMLARAVVLWSDPHWHK